MKYSAVIPMAGIGSRTGLNVNKALALLNGKPMFMYSYDTFKKMGFEVILVVKAGEEDIVRRFAPDAIIAYGGETRAKSVLSGIKMATGDIVLVHDAARPFISSYIISNVLKALDNNKCAYAGIYAKDTLRSVDGNIIDRDKVITVQTPQAGFRCDFLKAFEMGGDDNLTDDIQYLEKYLGYKAYVVEGSDLSFKITTSTDYKIAEIIAKGE